MTKEYVTETGFYVIRDSDGRVISKANVPTGSHLVDNRADMSESHDLDKFSDLENVDIDDEYTDSSLE
jgi:hypothetical protein